MLSQIFEHLPWERLWEDAMGVLLMLGAAKCSVDMRYCTAWRSARCLKKTDLFQEIQSDVSTDDQSAQIKLI